MRPTQRLQPSANCLPRVCVVLVLLSTYCIVHTHGKAEPAQLPSWKAVIKQLEEVTKLQRGGGGTQGFINIRKNKQQQKPGGAAAAGTPPTPSADASLDDELAAAAAAEHTLPGWTWDELEYEAADLEELQGMAPALEPVAASSGLRHPLPASVLKAPQQQQQLAARIQSLAEPRDAVAAAAAARVSTAAVSTAARSSSSLAVQQLEQRQQQLEQQQLEQQQLEQQQLEQPPPQQAADGGPSAPPAQQAADPLLHVSPPPTATSTATVNPARPLLQIPQSFLGLSHEWTHVEDLDSTPGYKRALKLLSSYGSGPLVIRVGGGSTDKITRVLPQAVYAALARLHQATGARFILGVNGEQADVALARKQLAAAQETLPESAVLTYELGNEPNFYNSKRNLTAAEYARCCLATEWAAFAQRLSCPCSSAACCVGAMFAGPVYGHLNVFPSTIKFFLDNAARYVSLVTVHYYRATREAATTPTSLLDEVPLRQEMDNLAQLVQVSNSYGKPLRVAEMNSISNSGRAGVSNSLAAALWSLDAAFEAAAAGAVGVNFHQGAGQSLYTALVRTQGPDGALKPVVVRPPFYGMLLFQQAVRGGSLMLAASQQPGGAPHIKLWPLLDGSSGEVRVVAINKHPKEAATQVLRLGGGGRGSRQHYHSVVHLTRLVARGDDPLSATEGVTLGGHRFIPGCEQRGHEQTLLLDADGVPDERLTWTLYLPPGSATLVRIKPRAEAQ